MVRKDIARLWRQLLARHEPTGNYPDTVEEQGGICRMMDISLNGRRINTDFPARLDLLTLGVAYDLPVDRLPGLFR